MATKKYLSLDRLTEYDGLIKATIDSGDVSVKSYVDTELAKKANSSHTHDDRYYTETEIDTKLSTINTSITNITNGSTPVKEAEHADSATSSLDAEKLGGQLPSYYAKASDIPTGALAKKNTVSESDLDNALAEKVNAAAEGNHSHSNKTVLDGITSAKVTAWNSAEANAKAYADGKIANLLDNSTEAVDSIMELAAAMEDNADAIEALEGIAAGKAPATHSHAISDVTNLQSTLNAKAAQTSLDSHTGNGDIHVTAALKSNWNAAYTHSQAAHAPAGAQANVIETIKVNGTALTPSSKAVNITVPTDYLVAADIANKADKSTTLSGYGITNAYTKTEVDNKLSAKANQTSLDSVSSAANEAKTASAANTTAIGSNTSAISALTGRVATLEGLDTCEPIPTASITGLFSS